MKIDRFMDLETANWSDYVIGGVVDAGSREYFSTTSEEEFFLNLVDTGGTVWNWNGGRFDSIWFVDMARRLGFPCVIGMAGSGIVRLQCEKLILRDAMAIVPMSLQKASVMTGPMMSKETGLPCVCDDECGGYCSISRDMPAHLLEALDEYLKQDCLRGLDIVEAVISEAERCEYVLGGTIGGSSYATAKKHLDLPPAKWKQSTYNLARAAYFGGRTEVYNPTARHEDRSKDGQAFAYDINSAYPAALVETALPVGSFLDCEKAKATRAYNRGKDGCFMASVSVPAEMFIPPLPVRVGNRVAFPVGEFKGVWTALELREAESLGCTVQINGGLVWGTSEKILAPFMQHVWDKRAENRENKAMYLWHKFMANSLTGKLAERPDKERVMLYPDAEKIVVCDSPPCANECNGPRSCVRSTCCFKVCRGTCGRWNCIDAGLSIYSAPLYKISDCGHVQWAAYLTAAARIKLARQLRADGQGGRSAVYCDTDSVFSTEERSLDIGPDLGQWGADGELEDFLAIAPKLYRYRNVETGEETIKAKGLSGINRADFDAFCSGKAVKRDKGVETFKVAAKNAAKGQSIFVRKELSRASHADGIHYGSRVLREDGKTYPQTIQQIEEAEREKKR